jgi:opacity protein-like surface antigen
LVSRRRNGDKRFSADLSFNGETKSRLIVKRATQFRLNAGFRLRLNPGDLRGAVPHFTAGLSELQRVDADAWKTTGQRPSEETKLGEKVGAGVDFGIADPLLLRVNYDLHLFDSMRLHQVRTGVSWVF